MNRTLLAALNDSERMLVAETEGDALALLDEDGPWRCTTGSARTQQVHGPTAAAPAPA